MTAGSDCVYINPRSDVGFIDINYNNFDGYLYSAICFEADYVNATYNVIESDDPLSTYGIRVFTTVAGVTFNNIDISYNEISNVVKGVRVGNGSDSAPGSTLSPAVEYNTITNCDIGVWIRAYYGDPTVHYNDLSGNISYGMKNDSAALTVIDAEDNWWGSANGPTHAGNTFNVTAQGDNSSDYVDYVPWYDTDMTGSSFAPVDLYSVFKDAPPHCILLVHTSCDRCGKRW